MAQDSAGKTNPGEAVGPTLEQRITDYLSLGGLWNPDDMEHAKVRDLLIDCREELAEQRRSLVSLGEGLEELANDWQSMGDVSAACARLRTHLAVELRQFIAEKLELPADTVNPE